MEKKTKIKKADKKEESAKKLTKDERHEIRRREIVEAAKKCVVKKGFHNASVDMIAKEAGINVGQMYRYYKNKEAIIEAIAEDIFKEAAKAVDKGGFYALFDSAHGDNSAFMHEIHSEAMRNPAVMEIINKRKKEIDKKLKEFVIRENPQMSKKEAEESVEIISIIMGGVKMMTHKLKNYNKKFSDDRGLKILKAIVAAVIPSEAKK